MKDSVPRYSITTIYKRGRNLKELIALSLYPRPKHTYRSSINSCGSCDICNNFFTCSNIFTCTLTKNKYFLKREFNCNANKVI